MVSKLRYGNTNTFLVQGENGYLLVDTDYAGTMPAFYRAIKKKQHKSKWHFVCFGYSLSSRPYWLS